jgi:alpha-L-fucosidase 2
VGALPHPANGFTFAGAAIYDSLIPGRADAARDQLMQFVYGEQYPHGGGGGANALYTEGSQCNESPLMLAFALQQMLLQSFDGQHHVFPALPSSWPNATFFQMRTEGAFLVSASARHGLRHGKVRAVSVTATRGSGAACILHMVGGLRAIRNQQVQLQL